MDRVRRVACFFSSRVLAVVLRSRLLRACSTFLPLEASKKQMTAAGYLAGERCGSRTLREPSQTNYRARDAGLGHILSRRGCILSEASLPRLRVLFAWKRSRFIVPTALIQVQRWDARWRDGLWCELQKPNMAVSCSPAFAGGRDGLSPTTAFPVDHPHAAAKVRVYTRSSGCSILQSESVIRSSYKYDLN